MSDFFSFGSNFANKTLKEVSNNILLKEESPHFYILIDEYLSKSEINILKKLVDNKINTKLSFSVIYSFKTLYTEKDITKNILNFVLDVGINVENFIPPNSKVLAMGRSLYNITKDTSVQLSAFQEIVWNKSYFYAPELKSWIFPTAAFSDIYNSDSSSIIDSYDKFHFDYQVNSLKEFNIPKLRIPKIKIEIVEEPNKFLYDNMDKPKVSWDLETGGFNCMTDQIDCLTISFDGKIGYYLRFEDINKDLLNEFLKDKFQIGANLKFDCRFLSRYGITNAKPSFDTMHAGHCLNEMRSNSLKTHAWLYTYNGGYDFELEAFKRKYKNISSYSDIPESVKHYYAGMDAVVAYQSYEAMEAQLQEDPLLRDYFYNHVMPTVQLFVEIETQGIFIDWDQIKLIHEELFSKQQELEQKIWKLAGIKFDVSSAKQLGDVFRDHLKLPNIGYIGKDQKTWLTGEEPLKEWKKLGYEIADLVLEHRGYSALLNTFVGEETEEVYSDILDQTVERAEKNSAYWEYKAPNGRIYPNFMVMMAKSHRNKAFGPNLQQVPHHGEKAWMIRSFFDSPSDDYFISEFDYSGLQLRIAAIMSGDENMKTVFTKLGGDLHSMTAQAVFAPDITLEQYIEFISRKEEPYKEWRFEAKGINFGYLFGMGAFTYTNNYIRKGWSLEQCKEFVKDHNIPKEELQKSKYSGKRGEVLYDYYLTVGTYMRKNFFKTYSSLEPWHESQHSFAEKYGYIRCVHGARRHLPQLLHPGEDGKLKANLQNISINSPVQNFEIVMISRAMRNFNDYCKANNKKSRLWVTTHDAVGFYIHKDEEKEMQKVIPQIMTKDYPEYMGIPIEVEGDLSDPRNIEGKGKTWWGYGRNWHK